MRYLVCGVGAIGGYFGGRLLEHGHQVDFLARGERLSQLNQEGVIIHSQNGDCRLTDVTVIDKPDRNSRYDVIIVAVKSYHLEDIVKTILPVIDKNTTIIPLLNGVSNYQRFLSLGIKGNQIILGFANIICRLRTNGIIEHVGAEPHITLGVPEQLSDKERLRLIPIVESVSHDFTIAKVKNSVKDQVMKAIWGKYLFVAPWAALSSVVEKPIGIIRLTSECNDLLLQLMCEYREIAKAQGIEVADKVIDNIRLAMSKLPEHSKTSMQQDVEQGKKSEFDVLVADAIALANQHQLSVPAIRFCYACLLTKIEN